MWCDVVDNEIWDTRNAHSKIRKWGLFNSDYVNKVWTAAVKQNSFLFSTHSYVCMPVYELKKSNFILLKKK